MDTSAENIASGGFFPEGLYSDAFVTHPFPFLARMRSVGPVVRVPSPAGPDAPPLWMVVRFEEAVQVFKDNTRFVHNPSTAGNGTDLSTVSCTKEPGLGDFFRQSMAGVDGREHRRLRQLVSKVFTPKYIQSLRPSVQRIADELLNGVQEHGHMDLVYEYAFPLPIQVISTILGVPLDGQALIREWAGAVTESINTQQESSPATLAQTFREYLSLLVAEKRAHPLDDLMSYLIQVEEMGDRLNEEELLAMIALLIYAGHETTSNLIGAGILALFDHPAQLHRLKDDLSLVPVAVEELLRYASPVMAPARRYATEDVTLGDQKIQKGDQVVVIIGSANRDESQFTQAQELNIARNLNHHLAFAQGVHSCLGAPLARLEGEIALATLLRRLPDVRLALPRDAVTWKGGIALRGISSLPVVFSSEPR